LWLWAWPNKKFLRNLKMILETNWPLQDSIWRRQLCSFFVPMGGCHLGLLVYSSQDLLHALLSSSLIVDSFWFLCVGRRPKLCNNWSDSTLV
jgi:hypothetical protein